jgi:broad specificity phosphatase PhoE
LTEVPSLVATSRYRRAGQTAEPTLRRFPGVPCEEWDVHEFTYLGSLHGRLLSNAEREPYAAEYWERADPYAVDRPEAGAESFAGMLTRAERLLARLESAPAGLVIVFTHGMFIRGVDWFLRARAGMVDLLDMTGYREHHQRNPVPNASVTVLGPGDIVSDPVVLPATEEPATQGSKR